MKTKPITKEELTIVKFGEKRVDGAYNAFIEYGDGTKEKVGEGVIESLWNKWVMGESDNPSKDFKDGYNIYIF